VQTLSGNALVICIFSIILVPLAGTGLALINTGLGRSRSAAHAMLSALCAVAVAAFVYFVIGFAWQGVYGGPAHSFTVAGKSWSWLGADRFMLRGVTFDGSTISLIVCLQFFSVGLAAQIPLGSGADRWRLRAICASSALLAGVTYPLFAHWAWGGGWLSQLGMQFGLGNGFIDVGGAGAIQVVGGLTALSMTWILGARHGKFEPSGMSAAVPGHNTVFVLLGCMLAFLGWLGLDTAGAILFAAAEPTRIVLIAVNNLLAAGTAMVSSVILTGVRFGKPDASLAANGFICGLVAVSCSCAMISPLFAIAIGMVAGLIVPLSVEWLDRLLVDDPGGAISVHAVGGLWGLLAAGLFVHNKPGQWAAQLAGVAALLGVIFPLTYGLNWLLNLVYRQRVSLDGERHGLDMHELGAGAYPESAQSNDFLHH